MALRARVLEWRPVCAWKWSASATSADVCGICHQAFETCCSALCSRNALPGTHNTTHRVCFVECIGAFLFLSNSLRHMTSLHLSQATRVPWRPAPALTCSTSTASRGGCSSSSEPQRRARRSRPVRCAGSPGLSSGLRAPLSFIPDAQLHSLNSFE